MLTALLQLFREANLLQNVLRQKNSNHYNPLRLAVVNHQFEITVLLFKECLAVAEDAITELDTNSKEAILCIHVLMYVIHINLS